MGKKSPRQKIKLCIQRIKQSQEEIDKNIGLIVSIIPEGYEDIKSLLFTADSFSTLFKSDIIDKLDEKF